MRHPRYILIPTALLCACAAFGQTFDSGNNAALHGDYFVREVTIAGQNTDSSITSAKSATGIITFDGKGNYSFNGQTTVSTSLGVVTSLTLSGIYRAAPNGFFSITSLTNVTDTCYGGVSAIGPSAIVASATEGTSVDMLVAVPASTSNNTNAALKGSYIGGFLDFTNASTGFARQANFVATADGAGNFGNIAVTGSAQNLGGLPMSQTVNAVSYSLSGEGAGTITFGAANSGQLLSGSKTFYISADGNVVLGGSPGGFDMLVGIRSLTAAATNATSSGFYYVAGMEDYFSTQGTSIDGFYGSANANGLGTTISHYRYQSFGQSVYDFTYDNEYAVPANGVISLGDYVYKISLGLGGQAFLATGTSNGQYSLLVGLGATKYSGTGVYLNPLGVVNAANFAPATNPVAPNEIVTLYGTGLAGSTVVGSVLPLATTLGGVQVTVNGQTAPLFYVSPTQIAVLVPGGLGPDNGVAYATFQVTYNGAKSNAVTMYTANSAPGVFTAGGNGVGPALAQHADYSLVTATNPAKLGETVVLYGSGLGSVNPAVASGAAAGSNPPSTVIQKVYVEFGNQQETVAFAGLTPGLAGLYQVNTTVVSGTLQGSKYANISTVDGFTDEATIAISGAAVGASSVKPSAEISTVLRLHPAPEKLEGLRGRAQ